MNNFKNENKSILNGKLKEPPKSKIGFNEKIKSISFFWLFISFTVFMFAFSYRSAQNKNFKEIRLSIDTMRFFRFNEQGQLMPIKPKNAQKFKIP